MSIAAGRLASLGCFQQAFTLLEERAASGRRRREAHERAALLTAREKEVLAALVAGQSNKQIGEQLGLSALTVKSHLARIARKLGTGDRAEMVAMAMRAGVIR